MKVLKRPSKDEYYLSIAATVMGRAVCWRRFSGAIIVRGDQIVSTGYTGSPRGTLDCFQRGYCLREKLGISSGSRYEICASVHAEQNAIINAARAGVSLVGGDLFISATTFDFDPAKRKFIDAFPCFICKKEIINAGIIRVIRRTKDGKPQVFHVEDWIKEWQDSSREITDDTTQYGQGLAGLGKDGSSS